MKYTEEEDVKRLERGKGQKNLKSRGKYQKKKNGNARKESKTSEFEEDRGKKTTLAT